MGRQVPFSKDDVVFFPIDEEERKEKRICVAVLQNWQPILVDDLADTQFSPFFGCLNAGLISTHCEGGLELYPDILYGNDSLTGIARCSKDDEYVDTLGRDLAFNKLCTKYHRKKELALRFYEKLLLKQLKYVKFEQEQLSKCNEKDKERYEELTADDAVKFYKKKSKPRYHSMLGNFLKNELRIRKK